MQAAFVHTLTHYDANKGSLNAYIKSLARVLGKRANKEICVDFLEQTIMEDGQSATKIEDKQNGTTKVFLGNTKDFTNEVIFNIEKNSLARREIVCLSLEFMDKFVTLCDALERHDTSTMYYPDIFIKSCMRINSQYDDFNQRCIDLYYEFADYFNWFINIDENNEGAEWRETDHLLISSNLSKRVKFVNKRTNQLVENADAEEWYVKGKLSGKHIIKVKYSDVWNMMCDLVDADNTNEIKFIIDDFYVIKTFGGSYSVLNPSLYNIYDLVRTEILTNILRDTGGRLINAGSENFYILCDTNIIDNINNNIRVVRGYTLRFDCEDITAKTS